MISVEETLRVILSEVKPFGITTVYFENALGHVLSEDIVAGEDIPPFDNSAMDGYAVHAEDTMSISSIIHVIDEIPAGSVSKKVLQRGEAMSIMTGAPIPEGCDAVIQIEWVERINQNSINPLRAIVKGHNIRKAGKDAAMGTVVLKAGTAIRPQEIGVLASLGKEFVQIVRPPSVAILATGDELISIKKPLSPGKIRNSNLFVLKALLRQLGCEVIDLGISRDDKQELTDKIKQGLLADILITSGGVSVGTYDFVLEIFTSLGIEQKLWKVNIKPGMPFMFGMYQSKPVFALPGNPVSTYVTFIQFVKPALLAMKGQQNIIPITLQAILKEPIKKNDGKRHFIRGILEVENDTLTVSSTGAQVSNMLTSLSKANCLIIIPENAELLNIGDSVKVELI